MLDIDRLRADTPGCAYVTHLNNAGAALPPQCVLDTVLYHLTREATIGGYEAAAESADRLAAVYDSIARLIGCDATEIAIVENATRAWDMAFYALAARFRPGDRILTSQAEYASNVIAFLQAARRTGAKLEVVPDDAHGQLSVGALASMIDERVRLIAVTHVPTQGGLVNPAEDIGAVAREAGVPYLLDACQSVGQLPIDVGRIGCDLLSATSRKFLRGPRGVGFLYVSEEILGDLEPPLLDLHAARWTAPDAYEIRADARRFENWESNVAAKLGLGAAIDYALALDLDEVAARIQTLAADLRERLAALPGVVVRDLGLEKCGIVTFTVAGYDAPKVVERLCAQAINTSAPPLSHARYDLGARRLPDLVRASVHYYNTEEELDRLVAAVRALPAP